MLSSEEVVREGSRWRERPAQGPKEAGQGGGPAGMRLLSFQGPRTARGWDRGQALRCPLQQWQGEEALSLAWGPLGGPGGPQLPWLLPAPVLPQRSLGAEVLQLADVGGSQALPTSLSEGETKELSISHAQDS